MKHTLFVCTALISIVVLAVASIDLSPTLYAKGNKATVEMVAALEARLSALEGTVAALQAAQGALQYMTVDENPINGMPGPHIIITGANLHIRSGEGVTDGANTGVGNLVVGYNEQPSWFPADARDGTHNLIVGPKHRYPSSGGFLAGFGNETVANFASVSGGWENTASGLYASVSGGAANTASGERSSVSGGFGNTASGERSSVSGGEGNEASAPFANVSGGEANTASGFASSVSGGESRTVGGFNDWRAGGLFQDF